LSLVPVTDPKTGAVTFVDTVQPSATPVGKGEAGYDYDPYDTPGEKAEGFFVGKLVNRFVSDPDGFCSTYREWHILWRGAYAGFRGATLGDVPKCPPLWQDEAQYFESAAMVANVVKCQWPAVVVGLGSIGVGAYTGIIPVGTIDAVLSNILMLI
jgi:hypothetical protein